MECPDCHSKNTVKNGMSMTDKQKYKCNACGRQFVLNPAKFLIPDETKNLINRLLLERISLAGIARITGVSERWLQDYVNHHYKRVPRQVVVKKKSQRRLTIECDELWSFVKNSNNKQWVWLAIDRDTREIIGVHVGDRSRDGAEALWQSLPPVYRQCAVSYTDFWASYETVLPSKRHRAVGKESGQTNHIERFNCTLRQRVSRLVRKTLSFSKNIANHVGAIWYFIHYYNAMLPIHQVG